VHYKREMCKNVFTVIPVRHYRPTSPQSSGLSSPLCFMQMRVGGSVKTQLS